MSINFEQLKKLRREIHADPELSGRESKTATKVLGFIRQYNPDEILTEVGGHGVIATWDSGKPGKEILFRAELDALPIEEINTFDYKSSSPGVSHKCGHDGHSTILCGLAQHLNLNRPKQGKVRLVFQPAEENGEGAKAIIADAVFNKFNPDFVFALHNLPGYPLHEVVVKDGTFTAAVNSIVINLNGKTSHAAEPELGFNPALAVSEIIKASLEMANNFPDRSDMSVVTPVFMEMGSKDYGISAGKASVHLTLRCWNDENLKKLENQIAQLSAEIALKYSLKVTFEYTQTFHANMNASAATDIVRSSAKKKKLALVERSYPFKWGEDFGLFTAQYNGCMFGLGAGVNLPALHNPDYDFPDELIESGVKIFSGIIDEILLDN